ncbi:MAG: hypothetical protein GY711_30545 [bacterium]|nr:hypothetical protein [bacterium]
MCSPSLRVAWMFGILAAPASAQDSLFRTPGMPARASSGQTDRFSNEFNPAIGVVIDAIVDHLDTDVEMADDGFDATVRSFEASINGRVDPDWWLYATVVYADEDEEIELEEAASHFTGFDSNTTLRFGRFFADFGKQMQAHVHDLPYPERPGVLAEYLGDELPGTGAQIDHWWVSGDASTLRASFGVFADLERGHEDDDAGTAVALDDRKDADELALSLRATQFMDVGETGVFQWGFSALHLADFAFEDEANGLTEDGLSNTVYGLDLTYGVDSEDGLSGWTFGGEYLIQSGDIGAETNGAATALEVLDDDVSGFYAWGERRFGAKSSAGILYGQLEHPEEGTPSDNEVTAYYTRNLSEYARLRFAVSQLDADDGGDETRLLIQLTTFAGPHAHGVNW